MAATRYFAFRATVEQLGDREIIARASDESVGRDGMILETAGCNLQNYRRNPIVLRDHSMAMPVGRCTDIRVSGKELIARIEFAALGVSADADQTCALAKTGTLNALSCGFDIIKIGPPHNGIRTVSEWELLELSIVAVPALASAVILQRANRGVGDRAGVLLKSAQDHLARARQHCDTIRDCIRRRTLAAADEPHRRMRDNIRGAQAALDEAADHELPDPGRQPRRRLNDARRYARSASVHHRDLGAALDDRSESRCRAAHGDLDRSLRACAVATDDAIGRSVAENDELGVLADPANQGTSRPLSEQLDPNSKTFGYTGFAERQADAARLRKVGGDYRLEFGRLPRPSCTGALALWHADRAAEHARQVRGVYLPLTVGVATADAAISDFASRQADKAEIMRTFKCPQTLRAALDRLFPV